MRRTTRARAVAPALWHDRPRRTGGATASPAKETGVEPVVESDAAADNIYGVSDRELERQRSVVKKEKKKKKKAAAAAAAAAASTASTPPTPAAATSTPSHARASPSHSGPLSAARRRRDAAMHKLDALTSTTTTADAVSDSPSPAAEASRRDSPGAWGDSLLDGGRGCEGPVSGLEINDSEIFGHLDSSFGGSADRGAKGRGEAGGAGGTRTRSVDSSASKARVFGRWQGRASGPAGPHDAAAVRPSTSRAPATPGLSSTFSLGNFRRRTRQPSILLSSAQKPSVALRRSRPASEASGDAAGSEGDDDGDSFLPEAEGTPVRPSRGRASSVGRDADALTGHSTQSRKRRSAGSLGAETAKKRQAVEAEMEEPGDGAVEMVDYGSSPPSVLDRATDREDESSLDDSVLAPPASNSSASEAGSVTVWPSLRDLGKGRRRQRRGRRASPRGQQPAAAAALEGDDMMSDVSEPPSLTHSPPIVAATKAAVGTRGKAGPPKEPATLTTTADLAALLPRRRRKARRHGHDSDDEGSGGGAMYDTSSQGRPRRNRTARLQAASSTAGRTARAKQAEPTTHVPSRKSTGRTYGSRRFDRDNTVEEGGPVQVDRDSSTPLDDDVFVAGHAASKPASVDLGEELRAASRKFKEVDKWQLEFEEVTGSSSPLYEGR